LAKVTATLALLAYLWVRIDPLLVVARIGHTDAAILIAGTSVLALQPLIGAARWRLIIACLDLPPSFIDSFRWTYVSVFFGQVLPATVGADGVRVWLAHRGGSGLGAAFNSVALDRLMMLLTLAALIALGAPTLARLTGIKQLGLLAPLLWVGGAFGLAMLMVGDRLPASWRTRWIGGAVGQLARDSRRFFRAPGFVLGAAALCLIGYGSLMVAIYLFAMAFGATARPFDFLVLVPPVLAASTLPVSIGGWGTREFAMVAALGLAAIKPDTAMLASLWLGVASVIVALPGAGLYLIDRTPLRRETGRQAMTARL
jgi:hypothetical protein